MAEIDWSNLKVVTIVVILVVLKTLEVVYRKLAEWGQAAKERQELARSGGAPPAAYVPQPPPPPPPQVQEQAATPGAPAQVYLPYEEVAEQIFGPYIELRKQIHKARQKPKPAVYDDVVIIDEASARRVRVAKPEPAPKAPPAPTAAPRIAAAMALPESAMVRPSMTTEQARKAFIASLIFSPPPGLRRLRGR